MSRSSTLILVGFLTIIISYAGVPLAWLHILLPIFGLVVIVIGFLMRTEGIAVMRSRMPPSPQVTPASPSPNDISPIA